MVLSIISALVLGCPNKPVLNQATDFHGIWIRDGDSIGRQPADTLFFFTKDGKNLLAFYSAGSPGPNWPSQVETEYEFESGTFSFRNYSGNSNEFLKVRSFQWVAQAKGFTVKLHEILLYISADYSVSHRKVN